MSETYSLEAVIGELPAIYRVAAIEEVSVGAQLILNRDNHYEVSITTETPVGEYRINFHPQNSPDLTFSKPSGELVIITLDKSFAEKTEWRGGKGRWQTIFPSPTGPLLITADCDQSPSELSLITVSAADLDL